jgi:hypothetical protein
MSRTYDLHHLSEVKLSQNLLKLTLDLINRICIDFCEHPSIFV